MSGDWVHGMLQAARAGSQDWKQTRTGYCTVYSPVKGMAKFIVPELRDENDNPFETGWCKVGTIAVGAGFGIQYALKGGATAANPGNGEECQLTVQQRSTGYFVVANLNFNDNMTPPGAGENNQAGSDGDDNSTDDTDGTLQLRPGEFIVMHESGSFLKFYSNGDIQLNSTNNLALNAANDINMTAGQDINVTSNGGSGTPP